MKQVLLAISAALIGAGNGLKSFANDEPVPDNSAPAGGGDSGSTEAPKRGRGRPAGGGAAAADTGTGAPSKTGPTDEERFESNRALIKPLIDSGQGEDVKKVTAKYSSSGIKGIPADKQADFVKDIEALTY